MIPFEYSTTAIPIPDAAFLYDISAYLKAQGLERIFGITSTYLWGHPMFEHQLRGGGTIATEVKTAPDWQGINGIDTVWGFSSDGHIPEIKVLRKCEEASSGGHKVT